MKKIVSIYKVWDNGKGPHSTRQETKIPFLYGYNYLYIYYQVILLSSVSLIQIEELGKTDFKTSPII